MPDISSIRLVGPGSNADAPLFGGERLLTAVEVAQYLQVPTKKVYELPLPRVRLSEKRVRFLKSDISAYVSRNRSAA